MDKFQVLSEVIHDVSQARAYDFVSEETYKEIMIAVAQATNEDDATVAQLAEQHSRKVHVVGSTPTGSSEMPTLRNLK